MVDKYRVVPIIRLFFWPVSCPRHRIRLSFMLVGHGSSTSFSEASPLVPTPENRKLWVGFQNVGDPGRTRRRNTRLERPYHCVDPARIDCNTYIEKEDQTTNDVTAQL